MIQKKLITSIEYYIAPLEKNVPMEERFTSEIDVKLISVEENRAKLVPWKALSKCAGVPGSKITENFYKCSDGSCRWVYFDSNPTT